MAERFERGACGNTWLRASIFLVPAIALAAWFFSCNPIQMVRVDDCLDRGGSHDYEAALCDFEQNHPVP